MAKTKQIIKTEKLKKGERVKINGEEYLVEDFDEEKNYNKKTGDNIASRDVILSKTEKGSKKLVREGYSVRFNKDKKSLQLAKVSEKKEKSKKGFSYEKSAAVVSYSNSDDGEDW